MPKKLYTFCCRLCLHDGSVNQLLDIYSIKALEEKLLKVFNIQVTNRDSCTTNICLPCLQETLTLEQQMMQYLKHKQNILNNQQRFQKNDAAAPSTSLSAPLSKAQTVECIQSTPSDIQPVSDSKISVTKSSYGSRKSHNNKTESSPSVHQTTLNNGVTDGGMQIELSLNANSETDKTKKNKNRSVKIKDKDTASQLSSKEISSKQKSRGSQKYHSQINPKSGPAIKHDHRAATKPTAGGLEKQSSSKNNPPDSTKRQNATNQTQPTKKAKDKVKIHIGTKKTSKNAAQQLGSENNAKRTNISALHKNPDSIIPNQSAANVTVSQVLDTVSTVEQNIPAYLIERTAPPESNQQSQSLQMKAVENSLVPLEFTGTLGRQRAFSQGVNNTLPNVSLQGGLCTSIPMANISPATLPTESRILNTASTVNQAEPSSNTSTAQGQQLATLLTNFSATTRPNESQYVGGASMVNLPATSTNAPTTAGQQLASITDTQTASCALAAVSQLDESRNSMNNATSPGAIKKRRHSTFIRVSSNLFDEPAEKAQFAMLNNNQFIRAIEPLQDIPALVPYPRLPVLPQGHRVQTVPNPTMPFNNSNCNTMSRYPPPDNFGTIQQSSVPTSQNNNGTQSIANSSHCGSNYGTNLVSRTVNTSTIGQRPFTIAMSTQQSSLAPNSSIRSNHTEYMRDILLRGNSTVQSTNIATGPANSAPDQQIRVCYKCNLCSSYYLLETSLVLHLRRIHQLEKSVQTCSIIHDPVICNTLISRIRRKSVADPLLLSNNRT
ncbi:serine-rich adhesin for platelets-like [Anopheles moucheti]|uniref:serine-rich adhesin for platelets-like n=1 Tax=Anopheles moucheti TaxID=186751 RepID=UPI0022F10464|nr:serine-rich adhesin for platelets-like [Anopheles moucheti]